MLVLQARNLQLPDREKIKICRPLKPQNHKEFIMAKHATFSQKHFSLKAKNDDNDTSEPSLYGQAPLAPTPSAISYPSSNVSKVYQHWADGDATRGTTAEWNNNILSDGKSDYFEGEVVPHAYFYKASNNTPLTNGQTYSFNVTYNYYQSNTNAGGFVYMTSPNADRSPGSFAGGDAQPDSTFTNGGGMQGSFYTVNANITNVSGVTYNGSSSSSKDAVVTISFVYTGPTTTSGGAEIQYGLMIAAPGDVPDQGKGMTDGANAWTGGSLQTTVDIGGSGATSIQLAPSAIIVGEISGTKFNDLDGNGIRDADGIDNVTATADDEVGLANWKIYIDQDLDGVWDSNEQFALTGADGKYALSVVPDSDRTDPDNDPYTVREVQQAGWVQTTTNPAPIVITALDPKEMNVDFGNMLLKPSLNIVKDAAVDGGYADAAGDIITYNISVQNTGNQTLTGVTVADPFIGTPALTASEATADGELDVGETWYYTATHIVTQAEIDAGQNIINVATADSDQTEPDTDTALVPVDQKPLLNIVKLASINGGTADSAGETINYTVTVENQGNQTLTGVEVTDPFIENLTLMVDAASEDGKLGVGETWTYSGSHIVTQGEIDAGQNIINVATADSDQTEPDTDTALVPVDQKPGLAIDKAILGVAGGNGNGSVDAVTDVISYSVTVSNTGNQTLNQVTVNDPLTGLSISGVTLAPGASQIYLTSYNVTQGDLDSYGGGDGFIENTATADSLQTNAVSDTEEIELFVRAALAIDKTLISINNGNLNSVADAAGDQLNYKVTVSNLGVLTLTNVSVVDPSTGLDIKGLTLTPGESKVFETSYVVTQQDLNDNGGGDGYIDNTATADSDQTLSLSDTETTALLRTVGLGLEKKVTSIEGGISNLFADTAGDVIHYTIRVYNAGTVTLTGVTVTDALTGLEQTIPSLAPGENTTYTADYTLQQADLDNNGGGNGYLENTSVADSNETMPVTDTETVQLLAKPILFVNKSFVNVTGGNSNNLVDAVGDQLNYQILLANPGNVTLTNVSLVENLTGLTESGLVLDPGDVKVYNVTYTLTQADLDNNGGGDGYVDNIVMANSLQTPEASDTESVPLLRSIGMAFDKEFDGVTGGNSNSLADFAGDVLNYSFTVTNLGNVTLTNLHVVDDLSQLNKVVATLAPGATQTFTASYTLQQSDLDSDGGGDRQIENYATADTDQTGPMADFEGVTVIYDAQIDLTKFVSVDNGVSWQDANALTGPTLSQASGIDPLFKYTALNNGTVTLKNLILTDEAFDLNGAADGSEWLLGDLAPGKFAEYIFEAPFALGQNSGDAVVMASTAFAPVLDIDNAYYLGV
jgi:uncharacterized repeat protein (TIGR01451 family)